MITMRGFQRIKRFVSHLVNKIPQFWAISDHEYQIGGVWASDSIREHRIIIEEFIEMQKRVGKRLGDAEVIKTKRSKRV